MPNITEEKWIEMLEKKADGSYIAKYPKVKSKSGITFDEHLADYMQHTPYAIATGNDSYAVSIPGISSLVEGMSVKVKFTSANTGACTLNINGLGAKEIRKSNGNALSSGNIKAGQICHLVYTGSVFQLLGEGGEYGTAQAQDVLEGKTIGTEEGLVTGTMPNHGAINRTITTQNGQITIPQGYHDGSGIVKAHFANLTSSNIKKGVNIGGVLGSLTIDGISKHGTIIPKRDDYTKPTRYYFNTNAWESAILIVSRSSIGSNPGLEDNTCFLLKKDKLTATRYGGSVLNIVNQVYSNGFSWYYDLPTSSYVFQIEYYLISL